MYVKVKFDDGRAFIYKTDDNKIIENTKVTVAGTRKGRVGVVIDTNVNYNNSRFDAYDIVEVLEYGMSVEFYSKILKGIYALDGAMYIG